jgi:hypothetical protein
MKTKEVMPGVEEIGSSVIRDTLARAVEIANIVKRIPRKSEGLALTLFRAQRNVTSLSVEIDILKKCEALSREFNVVKRDETPVKRKVKLRQVDPWGRSADTFQEWEFTAPLAWAVQLPAKKEFRMRDGGNSVSALVPPPPPAAIEQLKKHAKKFDRTEVWWVPKDILVTRPVSPDPIIVGIVATHTLGAFCFELHRWIDEDYEDSYWAREGY